MSAPTTFSKLMRGNTVIIVLCLVLMFSITFYFVRNEQINNRMETLKLYAYDIAQLAKDQPLYQSDLFFGLGTSPSRQLLYDKLRTLYEEYNAYCLVVNPSGRVVSFFMSILEEHKELQTNFDANYIVETLQNVLKGDVLTAQKNTKIGPMFTVAVPMKNQDRVVGAVYIQTAAQSVRRAYQGLSYIIALSGIVIFILAALVSRHFHKQLTSPLTKMSVAANKLSEGDFGTKIKEEGTKEMIELSQAFNIMSDKLEQTEIVRRDFLANISHELGSPLTSIRGFIQGMLDGTIEKEKQNTYLQIVLDETDRLSKLVSSLLKLSRMESENEPLNMSVFDIHEMIRLIVIARMNSLEKKHHEIIFNFDETPLFVYADKDKIEQVLINLLDNAIKYTPENGHISMLTDVSSDKIITVSVKDNGIGILEKDLPYVFDRFYMAEKAHTSGKGTGLGLAISKKIIEKHGQKIWVSSNNTGTEFHFTLEKSKQEVKKFVN
ncbi:MAG: HAMP domain-containing sensor histidine kinase [Eubacteriales bacterium]|nr:HAMP domain-containing sensor histidine kinase [Eubacteriales bacterium]